MQRNFGAEEEQFRTSEFRDLVRKRDRGAWDQLCRAYASRLEAVARGIVPARLDPESAAQQTWAKALAKAPRFARKQGSTRTPYPWLCSICINHCISVLRHDKVSRRQHVQDSLVQKARLRQSLLAPVGEGLRSPRTAMREESEDELPHGLSPQVLRLYIASLPKGLQRVLYLRFTCDFSLSVIAQLLAISNGAVRQRLSRAYRVLRARLEEGGAA
jgi:RNA polymerase sigma factor (sigma-70 family)